MTRLPFAAAVCVIALLSVVPSMAQQAGATGENLPGLIQPVGYTCVDSVAGDDACGCSGSCRTSACGCGACSVCCGACCNDIRHREQLFGDWLGVRSGLAQHGIVADIQWTQFYQGVASGGNDQTSAYGGKVDYNFTFMGEQMGLWKGLVAVMHTETRHGNDIILDAAPLAPSNVNMLYPSLENDTAVTSLQFIQMLSPECALTFGKFNSVDLFNTLYPQTGRGIEGFMNGSLLLPLTSARTLPLSFLGAGLMKMHGPQIQGAIIVYDSNNITTTTGFDVLFDNGANVLGMWRFFTEHNGLPGSHLFLGSVATGEFTSLDATGWIFYPPVGIVPGEQTGSWHFTYVLEQKLWVDCCNKNRHIGFLGQLGFADRKTSPFQWVMNASLQAQGLFFGRDQDTMGMGYFYSGLSDEFKGLVGGVGVGIDDLQGGEIYYNAAVTPWLHLTGDLQVIQPGALSNDTAVVAGVRANVKF